MEQEHSSSGAPAPRLAMIGSGWWATEIAEAACALGSPISACFSPTRARREAFAARFGCRAFDSLAALGRHDYDLLCIATPNASIVEIARRLAHCTRTLWLEKPAATDRARLHSLLESPLSSRVLVGYDKKFHPACAELGRRLRRAAGGIRRINAAFCLDRYATGAADWRSDVSHCPLGPFTQLGVHHVDTIAWLLDAPVVTREFTFGRACNGIPGTVTVRGECAGIPVQIFSDYTSTRHEYSLRVTADHEYELRCDALLVDGVPASAPQASLASLHGALRCALRGSAEDARGLAVERALAVLDVHDVGVAQWRRSRAA